MEVITADFAYQFHQIVGVAQFALAVAHAGGQVATQGDDATNTSLAVFLDQLDQFFAALADAGQVRGGVDAGFADFHHRGPGAVAGGAAGAISHGEKFRVFLQQFLLDVNEFFQTFVGLWGEELETDSGFHGCFSFIRVPLEESQ